MHNFMEMGVVSFGFKEVVDNMQIVTFCNDLL